MPQWGNDDIYDILRVNQVDRELRECRRDSKYLRKALIRADSNEQLRRHVFEKLDIASAPSSAPSNPPPMSVASWYGSKAPSGFGAAACKKAYVELCSSVGAVSRSATSAGACASASAPDPFADVVDEHASADEHENAGELGTPRQTRALLASAEAAQQRGSCSSWRTTPGTHAT